MSPRWITDFLGTAPALGAERETDVALLDVRDLIDRGGNDCSLVDAKITQGLDILKAGKRLIVCCDYGASRSNAIAAGILARLKGCSVDAAACKVIATTGEAEIKLELLDVVRSVVDGQERTAAGASQGGERILLTGASGFIGKAVVRRLKNLNVHVVAPLRNELDLLVGRAQLDMLIRGEGVTRVAHLANPRVYTSNLALGDTVAMLRNILETCVLNRVPMIYLSCWEIYSGYRTKHLLADESLPPLPSGPYGDTKFLCEVLIGHFRRLHGLKCALIRSSPVYGPGNDRPKFIYTFIEKARRGECITTHRYTNGRAALDFLHIDDASNAISKAIVSGFLGDLNIGSGTLTSTRQIADWVVEWLGSRSKIDSIPVRRFVARIAMDHRNATKELGWKPKVDLKSGMRLLVEGIPQPDFDGERTCIV